MQSGLESGTGDVIEMLKESVNRLWTAGMTSVLLLAGCVSAEDVQVAGLQELIDGQLAEGKTTVRIPPGRYRVTPMDQSHLWFRGLSDITVIADDVEMICTETTRAITIENCTNLTLRGLTVDYDPLPYTQGRITAIGQDRLTHEVELFDGYPRADKIYTFKYVTYHQESREICYGKYHVFDLEVVNESRFRFIKTNSSLEKDGGEKVGDLAVIGIMDAPGGYMPHAILSDHCQACTFENVTLYSSPCFSYFEVHCDGSTYRNCKLDRRAPEHDLVRREPRLRSGNTDAFHSKFAVRGPQILGCTARWQADDGVNICGAYHFVTQADGTRLRVLAKKEMDIQPGDPVELITIDGRRLPDAVVVGVTAEGPVTDDERKHIKTTRLLPRVQAFLQEAFIIELDRSVDLPFGSVICSMNRRGDGFAVKDCNFSHIHSRGILIKASNGEISGNRVVNIGMQGIKIAPEYHWLESGYCSNLRIQDNEVVDCGREALWIHAFGNYPAHRNLTVSGNRFQTDARPMARIEGLDGGAFSDNAWMTSGGEPSSDPFLLEYCTNMNFSATAGGVR